MKAVQRAAWHYTTGTCAAAIIADGCIKPTAERIQPDELPVAWFSRLDRWEPTASKGITDPRTGLNRTATIDEMEALARGLYRFRVDAAELLCWRELQAAARIAKHDAKALSKAGVSAGAVPELWMGSLTPVPLARVSDLQRLFCGVWISHPDQLERRSSRTRINTSVYK